MSRPIVSKLTVSKPTVADFVRIEASRHPSSRAFRRTDDGGSSPARTSIFRETTTSSSWTSGVDGSADGSPQNITEHDPSVDGAALWGDACIHPTGVVPAISDEGREFAGLARIDPESGESAFLLEYDWDIEGAAFARDGNRVAVVVNEDGYSRVEAYELDGEGRIDVPVAFPEMPRGIVSFPVWRQDGGALAFTFKGRATFPISGWPRSTGAQGPEAHGQHRRQNPRRRDARLASTGATRRCSAPSRRSTRRTAYGLRCS